MTNPPTRILIIGCSGSGKSTLTRAVAAQTNLPVIHLDANYFGPNWQEPSTATWRSRVAKLVARDRWVMDGNFSGTFDLRMPRADTVVFLNRPTWLCLWRVIKRTIQYRGQVRPGSAPGCKERFDGPFLNYVMMYNKTRRPKILRTLEEQEKAGKQVFILKSEADILKFREML